MRSGPAIRRARAAPDGWRWRWVPAFMLSAAVVFLVAPRPLIALYTRDPRVMAVGPSLLWIAAAFQIFDGIQTVSTGALRGLGETRAPMIANFVGYWILGLPLGFFLCFVLHWGIYGLWIGLTLALIVIATTLLVRWQDARAQAAEVRLGSAAGPASSSRATCKGAQVPAEYRTKKW